MKLRLVVLVLALAAALQLSAQSTQIVVVSDYDDTFRITGYRSLPKIWNALFTDKIFAGAEVLYQAFQAEQYPLYFVSNSPEMLRRKITRRLAGYHLKPDSVFLYPGEGAKMDYKLASIRKIAAHHPAAQLVLLGDDATADHLVYNQIRSEMPERVAAIYIRSVRMRELPTGQIRFYTEYEPARYEATAQRLKPRHAQAVATAVLQAPKRYSRPTYLKIATPFEACPSAPENLCALQDSINQMLIKR